MEENKILKKIIANNIRVIRAEKRLTQEKLADLAKLSQVYIYKLENEQTNPSIYTVFKIAKALNVTVNDLVY